MDIEIKAKTFDYGEKGWYDSITRIIGLDAKIGFSEDGTIFNIRSISPVFDETSCELAEM